MRDPVGTQDQVNLYTYVANNPIVNTDPDGRFIANAIGAGISVGIGAGLSYWDGGWDGMKDYFASWEVGVDAALGASGVGVLQLAGKAGKLIKWANIAWKLTGFGLWLAWETALWVLGDSFKDSYVNKCPKGISIERSIERNAAAYVVGSALGYAGGKLVGWAGQKLAGAVDMNLKYMPNWNGYQRACADGKCKILTESETIVAGKVQRAGKSAASRYKETGWTIPKWSDIDHMVDLQLGWGDFITNMWPLDSSVNRSLWAQIYQQIKNLPIGTKIWKVTISD